MAHTAGPLPRPAGQLPAQPLRGEHLQPGPKESSQPSSQGSRGNTASTSSVPSGWTRIWSRSNSSYTRRARAGEKRSRASTRNSGGMGAGEGPPPGAPAGGGTPPGRWPASPAGRGGRGRVLLPLQVKALEIPGPLAVHQPGGEHLAAALLPGAGAGEGHGVAGPGWPGAAGGTGRPGPQARPPTAPGRPGARAPPPSGGTGRRAWPGDPPRPPEAGRRAAGPAPAGGRTGGPAQSRPAGTRPRRCPGWCTRGRRRADRAATSRRTVREDTPSSRARLWTVMGPRSSSRQTM